ncbi:MAG TPA: hypothetical protein VGG33_29230 [Polyangia bacterium]
MITAALTAAITFLFHQFGVELSVAQIAGVAATVKVILVVLGAIYGGRFLRKRLDAAKAPQPASTTPGASTDGKASELPSTPAPPPSAPKP